MKGTVEMTLMSMHASAPNPVPSTPTALFVMPPTPKKLEGHIASGALLRLSVLNLRTVHSTSYMDSS